MDPKSRRPIYRRPLRISAVHPRKGSNYPPSGEGADDGNTLVSLHVTLFVSSLEVSGPLIITKRPLMGCLRC